jgi:hypothetical protein
MDSFYAGTGTFVEVPFAQRLNPGDYTASLSLSEDGNVLASSTSLAFQVPSLAADLVPQPIGGTAQRAPVSQAPVNQSLPQPGPVVWPWALALVALLGLLGLIGRSAMRSRSHAAHP